MKKEFNSARIKILVCCHKPCKIPKDEIFLPIQVGKSISSINLGIQGDNEVNGHSCDNISAKNKSYCELTAMYWAWKNIKKMYPDIKYIGLCHYRRFFISTDRVYSSYFSFFERDLLATDRILSILKKKDAILPNLRHLKFSIGVDYCISHNRYDLELLKKVIKDLYPKYEQSFVKVFSGNKFSPYNMFILPIEEFNSYCQWLFSILFNLENIIDIRNYNDYQRRIFGYMAERLLNVYVEENRLRLFFNPVICVDVPKSKGSGRIKELIADLLYNINMRNLFLGM
jgi:hypothetical protein